MNFVFQLREAAKAETNILTRKLLQDIATELSTAIDVLAIKRSAQAMKTLNGVWVRAVKILETHTPAGAPSSPRNILERKAA